MWSGKTGGLDIGNNNVTKNQGEKEDSPFLSSMNGNGNKWVKYKTRWGRN
jgi:hypothetical protein